jgi:hypothetical protein
MLARAKPGYRVVLAGSTHAFSEDLGLMPFLPPSVTFPAQNSIVPEGMMPSPGGPSGGGMMRSPPLLGSIAPARALAVTEAYLEAFFDEYLQGKSTRLLSGPSPEYPEISF